MLKKYASTLRIIGIVLAALSLIGGIIVAVQTKYYMILVYCAISAGLTYFFTLVLAELSDTVADNNEYLRKLASNVAGNSSATHSYMSSTSPRSTANQAPSSGKKKKSPYADPHNPNILICPNCKARQSSDNTLCFQCRTSLYDIPSTTAEKSETVFADITVDPNDAEKIICGKCGASQRRNRTVCFECGAKFNK